MNIHGGESVGPGVAHTEGDAIGDSARRMRGLLRGLGHDAELYALTIDEELMGDVRPFADPELGYAT